MRRGRAWRASAAIGVGAVLLSILVGGCSADPRSALTVDEVVAERAAALEAIERAEFDVFLGNSSRRFADLGLPLPEFQGVVAPDEWDSAVTACVVRLAPQFDGRGPVTYFGVVGEPFERTRWVLEGCIAQFGVADGQAAPPPGAVEIAWRYQDATQRVLPCLRAAGVVVPSPPSEADYVAVFGTEREWSPFALTAANPAGLTRALALCPPSSSLLPPAVSAAP